MNFELSEEQAAFRDDVGGAGLGRTDAAIVFEALAGACPSTAAFLSIHNMASWMIDAFGSDAQRQRSPRWTRSPATA